MKNEMLVEIIKEMNKAIANNDEKAIEALKKMYEMWAK